MASEAAKRAAEEICTAFSTGILLAWDRRFGKLDQAERDKLASQVPGWSAEAEQVIQQAIDAETAGLRAMLGEALDAVMLCQTEGDMTFVECCLCGAKTDLDISPTVGPRNALHAPECLITRIRERLEAKP